MKNKTKFNKIKRIIAIITIILLVSLYLITLILALCGATIYNSLLSACLLATLILPIFAFIIIWLFDRINGKPGPGDPVN